MKKIILTILMIIFFQDGYAQWSTYTPLTKDEILMPALIMKQRYDNNAQKVDNLIQYILDLKGQTNDKEFHSRLDVYYNGLIKYYNYDLANMDKEIRQAQYLIKEEVNNYNKRMASLNRNNEDSQNSENHSNKRRTKDLSNLTGYQKVYDLSPILQEPEMSSREVGKVKNKVVEILSLYDKNFFRVRSGDVEGYLWIGWLLD